MDDVARPSKFHQRANANVPSTSEVSSPLGAPAADLRIEPADVATVLRSLFAPHAALRQPGQPETPAASPLLWTMLAYARRNGVDDRTGAAARVSPTVQTAASVAATAASAPGAADGPVVIGADGTLYQVTSNTTGTRVSVLDGNGRVVTTTGYLPGGSLTSSVNSVAVRPDGTLLVSTTSSGLGNRSTILAVNGQGNVTTVAHLAGGAGGLTVGADGAVYTQTSITVPFIPYGSYGYHFVRISPTGAVRSLPPDTTLRLALDGSAYLLSTKFGMSTLHAFDTTGRSKTIPLPYSAADLSSPVLGPDGTLYLAADVRQFGGQTTGVYTVNGTASTVRTLPGLAGDTVVTDDGVYLETYTYAGAKDNGVDGTTYISTLTRTTISTLDPINGRISDVQVTPGFQVTPDGAVYAPIVDPSANTTAIAVFDRDGHRTTTILPGTIPTNLGFTQVLGDGPHADEFGFVRYDAGDSEHVVVLNANGTVARTIDLPAGSAVDGSVVYGPDGSPYVVLRYPAGGLPPSTLGTQILALSTDTSTPVVPGGRETSIIDVQFGPDGSGYLLTDANLSNSNGITITGFGAAGGTGVTLTLANPSYSYDGNVAHPVVFAPNGTGYVVDYGPGSGAVYALSSAGVNKVLDIPYATTTVVYAVVIGADGTPYLTTESVAGPTTTTVTPLTPPLA